jgi:hypothetical protein
MVMARIIVLLYYFVVASFASFTDYYELLGISRYATREEIRSAYKAVSRAHHPDVSTSENSTHIMVMINEAKSVLLDDEQREAYDKVLERAYRFGLTQPGMPDAVMLYMVCPEYAAMMGYHPDFLCTGIFFAHAPFLLVCYVLLEFVLWGNIVFPDWVVLVSSIVMRSVMFFTFVLWLCTFCMYMDGLWMPMSFATAAIVMCRKYLMKALSRFTDKFVCEPVILCVRGQFNRPVEIEVRACIAKLMLENDNEGEIRKGKRLQRKNEKGRRGDSASERIHAKASECTEVADIAPPSSKVVDDTEPNVIISPSSWPVVWTDEDLRALQKAITKCPPGTVDRWGKVSHFLGKEGVSEKDVLSKAKELEASWDKMKLASTTPIATTATSSIDSATAIWSAKQQKQLEDALRSHKEYKGKDKWEKIADCVEGKTRPDCVARYKYLSGVSK